VAAELGGAYARLGQELEQSPAAVVVVDEGRSNVKGCAVLGCSVLVDVIGHSHRISRTLL
jgi:hypothetical protein